MSNKAGGKASGQFGSILASKKEEKLVFDNTGGVLRMIVSLLNISWCISGLANFERVRAEFTRVPPGKSIPPRAVVATNVDVEEVIEKVTSGAPLTKPVPLGQMIDILVDLWEAEGLFD